MNVEAFSKLSYGVYIISSKSGDKFNAQIANVAFQVTAIPPVIAISINNQNLTCDYIKESKLFSISVLCNDANMLFIGKFGFKSGRDFDKFKDTKYKIGDKTGVPIVLDNTIACFEAKVVNQLNLGTHTVFFGEVLDSEVLGNMKCLTYDYYHNVIKGKSPKTAPTYFANIMEKGVKK